MLSENFFQNIVYASAEAHRLSLAERLAKRADQTLPQRIGKAAAGNLFKPFIHIPKVLQEGGETFDLINGGLSNLIFASSEQVLKINVRTLSLDPESVSQEVLKSKDEHEMCKQYMGEHWPEAAYSSRRFLNHYAVETRLPRFYPVELFRSVEDLLAYEGDEEYLSQLESLFTAVAELYRSTGYCPDILGQGNIALVLDDDGRQKLVILDTDIASPETQELNVPNQEILIKDAIAEKLDLWAKRLKVARELDAFRVADSR